MKACGFPGSIPVVLRPPLPPRNSHNFMPRSKMFWLRELPFVAHNVICLVSRAKPYIAAISLKKRVNPARAVARELLIYGSVHATHFIAPTVSIDFHYPDSNGKLLAI